MVHIDIYIQMEGCAVVSIAINCLQMKFTLTALI